MKAVLISIQPKWCKLIANRKKTVEVRKTKPKLETPFKVYIYCTNNKRQWLRKLGTSFREIFITENRDVLGRTEKVKSLIGEDTTFWENGGYNGKVIAEFVCDKVQMSLVGYNEKGCPSYWDILDGSCLTPNELVCYGEWKILYGWHISDLVIYDKPKELREFYRECEQSDCEDCPYLHFENTPNSYEGWCMVEEKIPIKRPFQSWGYVEELAGGNNG